LYIKKIGHGLGLGAQMIFRKIKTLMRFPKRSIAGKFVPATNKRTKIYLDKNGPFEIWKKGDTKELPLHLYDQYNLHALIRKRRPLTVLELGSGFSALTIIHALRANYEEGIATNLEAVRGKVWSLEGSKSWADNTRAKVPAELMEYADISYSESETILINGELCHTFKNLPNITPEFIYLDGPNPYDVRGEINGLGFTQEDGGNRAVLSADVLFYESSLPNGALIVVDSRFSNSFFLRRSLKRKYKVSFNHGHRIWLFELKDKLPPLSIF